MDTHLSVVLDEDDAAHVDLYWARYDRELSTDFSVNSKVECGLKDKGKSSVVINKL